MRTYCRGLVIDETVVEQAFWSWMDTESGKEQSGNLIKRYGSVDNLVHEIALEFKERRLTVRPIKYREIQEPSSRKTRVIGSMDVKHKFIDYIFYWCLRDLFNDRIGNWQCSSIKGRGQLYGAKRIAKYRREKKSKYFVKTDISQFYPSSHGFFIYRMLAPRIGSTDVQYLLMFLLSTYNYRLNIGSCSCQWIANLIMSFVYHFIENECWKERNGKRVRLYSRQLHYMDDVLIIGPSKANLKLAVVKITLYLRREFGLEIKPWKICMCDREDGRGEPIHMCGYRMWRDHMDVCEGTFIRARRAYIRMKRHPCIKNAYRCVSYYGYFKNSDCDRFIEKNNIRPTLKMAKCMISKQDRRGFKWTQLENLAA